MHLESRNKYGIYAETKESGRVLEETVGMEEVG